MKMAGDGVERLSKLPAMVLALGSIFTIVPALLGQTPNGQSSNSQPSAPQSSAGHQSIPDAPSSVQPPAANPEPPPPPARPEEKKNEPVARDPWTNQPINKPGAADSGMQDAALQKVNQTFPALLGAFAPYDEIALYTYSSTVSRVSDFAEPSQRMTALLNQMKTQRGRNNGVPVLNGPLAPNGPII